MIQIVRKKKRMKILNFFSFALLNLGELLNKTENDQDLLHVYRRGYVYLKI